MKFFEIIPIHIRKQIKYCLNKVLLPNFNLSSISKDILNEWKSHKTTKPDIIIFSIISWNYRYQRPQQIAEYLAKNGYRVFYIENEFKQTSKENNQPIFINKIKNNIYSITLSCLRNIFIYNDHISKKHYQIIKGSFETLLNNAKIQKPILIVNHPFWEPLVNNLDFPIIYDCMDLHRAFKENHVKNIELEEKLIKISDLVITTSQFLFETIKLKNINTIKICNGCDYKLFSKKTDIIPTDIKNIKHPVIGYFGAIDEWFDTKLIEYIAKSNPEKTILLIGKIQNNKVSKLLKNNNVIFLGEKPYNKLHEYLNQFDICIIPFLINDLIKATDPVKLYEYFSSGKPVITTNIPEVKQYEPLVYVCDINNVNKKIVLALSENKNLSTQRQKIAQQHNWKLIGKQFEKAIQNIN